KVPERWPRDRDETPASTGPRISCLRGDRPQPPSTLAAAAGGVAATRAVDRGAGDVRRLSAGAGDPSWQPALRHPGHELPLERLGSVRRRVPLGRVPERVV